MKVKVLQSFATLFNPMTVCSWNSPGQNTGVGSLSCLQGILPTQGLKPGLPHRRQILYQLSHKESPKDTGRGLPFPFPGNLPNPGIEPTSLLCPALAGGFFTPSTTWEALVCVCIYALIQPIIIISSQKCSA